MGGQDMVSQTLHISYGGPDRHIMVKGRVVKFEDHPHFGPAVLDARGEIKAAQPGETDPFWDAYERWVKQGKQVRTIGDKTWCKYETPLMEKRRMNKEKGTGS